MLNETENKKHEAIYSIIQKSEYSMLHTICAKPKKANIFVSCDISLFPVTMYSCAVDYTSTDYFCCVAKSLDRDKTQQTV